MCICTALHVLLYRFCVCACIVNVLIMTFFVFYEFLVDKKGRCSVLIRGSTLGLKKNA